MKVIYVRHNLGVEREILQILWDRALIALDFGESESIDPGAYQGEGIAAMRRLNEYCRTGVLAAGYFHDLKPTEILVGLVDPGSSITILRCLSKRDGRERIYKTVQLRDARPMSFVDFPLLCAIHPQRRTISSWPLGQAVIEANYFRRPVPEDVRSLSDEQLEVLAFHYLQAKSLIQGLVAPIGRSLIDIDIAGIANDGARVFAQVTFATGEAKISDKAKRLAPYAAKKANCYFFGCRPPKDLPSGVLFESIDNAFQYLLGHNAFGPVVKSMLGSQSERAAAAVVGGIASLSQIGPAQPAVSEQHSSP
jgi:hypothetical protein